MTQYETTAGINGGGRLRFIVWFAVSFLLAALVCWGCYLAGHSRGFHEGERAQIEREQASLALAPVTTISYDVGDVLKWKMDQLGGPPVSRPYDAGLVETIKRLSPGAASAKGWQTPRVTYGNGSIQVTAGDAFHQRVAGFLDQWRREHLPPDYQKTIREFDVSDLLPPHSENGDRTQSERPESDFQVLMAAMEQLVVPKIGEKLKPGEDLNANARTDSIVIKAKKETHQQVDNVLRIMRAIKFGQQLDEPATK